MSDTELLTEIRDLLRIIAEPQIAARDARPRKELVEIVGNGKKQQQAVLLMDGTRTRPQIIAECGIDQGHLSRLLRTLEAKGLLLKTAANPRISIPVPANFFEKQGDN